MSLLRIERTGHLNIQLLFSQKGTTILDECKNKNMLVLLRSFEENQEKVSGPFN